METRGKVANMELGPDQKPEIVIQYDDDLEIATGRSCSERVWQTVTTTWSALLERLSVAKETQETLEEYNKLPKTKQLAIKDTGGMIGGALKGGSRRAVICRTILALDADYAPRDFWEATGQKAAFAVAMHSTYRHTATTPRLRFYIPLSRPVTPEEYPAIARMIASDWGMKHFDDTTYEPQRLMFWPSVSKGVEYLFEYNDAPWLNPDDVLARYRDWQDITTWPRSERETVQLDRLVKKQEDPTTKPGIIGAFCRTYDIDDAIAEFLGEEYEPCGASRYTYRKGSTAGGLVVYDGGKFAYSNHATDPASGQLCNAFDLVRIHRFGEMDRGAKPGTPTNKLPSYQGMIDMARELPSVKTMVIADRDEEARGEFAKAKGDDTGNWVEQITLDAKGNLLPSLKNISLILLNDPDLKGRLALDVFNRREVALDALPWRDLANGRDFTDIDESQLKYFLENRYGIRSFAHVHDALNNVFGGNQVHPVQDYFNDLVWDGVKRMETLFIDYLGAADTPYTRTVTRKMFAAGAARIFEPGCKFDNMLILVGPQGVGKSTILRRMGGKWFSDSFLSVQGKESGEQLAGVLIMEIGELITFGKTEVENVKHFISKTEDRFRMAYGKRVSYFPRQNIFFGTTNNIDCLRDQTGNRRFWPVTVSVQEPTKDVFEGLTQDVIDLLWAEAVQLYYDGEPLYLDYFMEAAARDVQEVHTEEDPKFGFVQKYLDTRLPSDWGKMDIHKRQSFIKGEDRDFMAEGTVQRDCVCVPEIWEELFCGDIARLDTRMRRELHIIMQNMPGWKRYEKANGRKKTHAYGLQTVYVRVDLEA